MIGQNLVHFARVLRRAGLPVGPDRVLAATAALEAVGVQRRDDVHAALAATMLDSHAQQAIFDAAFATFWRDPRLLDPLRQLLQPKIQSQGEKTVPKRSHRLAEALTPPPRAASPSSEAPDDAPQELNLETEFSFSERERLQRADFETMTTAEFEAARRIAQTLPPPVSAVRQRRHAAAAQGRIDLRATLRGMARSPQTLQPAFTQPQVKTPPIVVLLDISGSMDRYARLFLHYVHGLTRRHQRVHCFTFGTRLSNITHCLRHRDPDEALAAADAQVKDWRSGTRIGACLDDFNRHWAKRVLGGNAALLLVTDGLDREDDGLLAAAAQQLHRRAHEVVWLNPLLRFEGFEPKAGGIRALLPHVDRFLPVHNLQSLADLGRALSSSPSPRH